MGYSGSQGDHLFFWADANPPLAYGDLSSAQPAEQEAALLAETFAGTGATGRECGARSSNPFVGVHVNPNFQAVEAVQPRAHSTYNSLQVTLSRQFANSSSAMWATRGPNAWMMPRPLSARSKASGLSLMPTTRASTEVLVASAPIKCLPPTLFISCRSRAIG